MSSFFIVGNSPAAKLKEEKESAQRQVKLTD